MQPVMSNIETSELLIGAAVVATKQKKTRKEKGSVYDDPVVYVREKLGDDPWSWQENVLRSVARNAVTAVPKCHSSGGTRVAAQMVCWWLDRWDDAVVYTLAPTWKQIRELLWRDIEDIHLKAKLSGEFQPKSAKWNFGPKRYAIGQSTDKTEQLQGPHAGHFLIIIDEASGFSAHLEPAVVGMLASGETRLLMLSQPTQLSGMFYDSCNSDRANVLPCDAFATPNFEQFEWSEDEQSEGRLPAVWLREVERYREALSVAGPDEEAKAAATKEMDGDLVRPYLVKPSWVAERYFEWGERSPLWQIRVRGRFPRQAEDSLISLDWIERAIAKGANQPASATSLKEVIGCDVARYGDDDTGFAHVVDGTLRRIWRTHGRSTMETTGQLKKLYDDSKQRIHLVIDEGNMGGGVVDRLKEQNVPLRPVNFGANPLRNEDQIDNRGSEIWWNLARAFEAGEIGIMPDAGEVKQLTRELLQPVYTFTSKGKIKVEKRGHDKKGDSPDLGDALALAWDMGEASRDSDGGE